MFLHHEKRSALKQIRHFLKGKTFQRIAIGIITLFITYLIILNGITPDNKLNINDISKSSIKATREVEDRLATEANAKRYSENVAAVMVEIPGVSTKTIVDAYDFINTIETYRQSVDKSLREQGISTRSKSYSQILAVEQNYIISILLKKVKEMGVSLTLDQVRYLIKAATDDDIENFRYVTKDLISNALAQDITEDNLEKQIYTIQNNFDNSDLSLELKNIANQLVKAILQPNKKIDTELTKAKRDRAYTDALENLKVVVKKGDIIIREGESLTKEKYALLTSLKLLKENKFNVFRAISILVLLILLAILLILYMNHFCKRILYSRKNMILLTTIFIMSIFLARCMNVYSAFAIPIFIAGMLISILLDLKLAIIVNFILTISISFLTDGNLAFIYMSLISGTFAPFFVHKAYQRSKLLMTGVVIAVINSLVIICYGVLFKEEYSVVLQNALIVSVNGVISVVLTTGSLPFWESVFNIITPIKLLELANPNQPLIKRLLMEAPGTYHHSLMVGNLAEVATEEIGGNAMLARVGAYFHDIGKLKRPNYFKENQLLNNPHDRMTANLSTLVITSHTRDGVELAQKNKIPLAVREIISQHHGTTLVAYFYHKAKKGEKGDDVRLENFRYEGPKPTSKEAAVVLLADSVEAAVRSMIDKTEGKIEGLVRKIIKDKLDDGQLDHCILTLKDLDGISKGFMKVFSGFFHEREEYPEIKKKNKETIKKEDLEVIQIEDSENLEIIQFDEEISGREKADAGIN